MNAKPRPPGDHTEDCLQMIEATEWEPEGLIFAHDMGSFYLCICLDELYGPSWVLTTLRKPVKGQPEWGETLLQSIFASKICAAVDALAAKPVGDSARAAIHCWMEDSECA